MQPSRSTVVFSVSSGAGHGLLFALAALTPIRILPADVWFTLAAFSLVILLVTAGLIGSTFHHERPEQTERSSWPSRERVAAIAVCPVAVLFAIERILRADAVAIDGMTFALAAASAAGATATVFCAAMIYASDATAPRWRNRWVVPGFLANGLMTGALWLFGLVHVSGGSAPLSGLVALAAVSLAGILKLAYWRSADRGGGATPDAGKHTGTLRLATSWVAFALPALLVIATGFAGAGLLATLLALAAAASASAGMLIERWLFLAEARG